MIRHVRESNGMGFVAVSLTAASLMGLCLLVLLVGAIASAQPVTTQAEFEGMRYPTRTMRQVLPVRLAKLDAAIHAPVATVSALAAIPAANREDGMIAGVLIGADSRPHVYLFAASSTATADGDLIVAPAAGAGRWYRGDGVDTTYDAGPGLLLSEGVFSLPLTCTAGQVLAWTDAGDGDWECVAQTDTTYSVTPGGGVVDTAGVLTLPTICTDNQILEYTTLLGWSCVPTPTVAAPGVPDDSVGPQQLATASDSPHQMAFVVLGEFEAGTSGDPDDVPIYLADALPWPLAVVAAQVQIITGTAEATVGLWSRPGGTGTEVWGAISAADAGHQSRLLRAELVPSVDDGLYLRRSTDLVAGLVQLTVVRMPDAEPAAPSADE